MCQQHLLYHTVRIGPHRKHHSHLCEHFLGRSTVWGLLSVKNNRCPTPQCFTDPIRQPLQQTTTAGLELTGSVLFPGQADRKEHVVSVNQ
tara:strand:+ start:2994 stop:3263 length:270 start_codon:yes stop_codon:yes gene_type:complete